MFCLTFENIVYKSRTLQPVNWLLLTNYNPYSNCKIMQYFRKSYCQSFTATFPRVFQLYVASLKMRKLLNTGKPLMQWSNWAHIRHHNCQQLHR